MRGVPKRYHYGPVSVGAPDKGGRDEYVQYGKMVGELVKRLCGFAVSKRVSKT
jgi:hypothetical protein